VLAEYSLVLLKNTAGLLPLDGNRPIRVGLTGPHADRLYDQLGDYTPPIRPGQGITLRQGLENFLRASRGQARLVFHPGCPMFGPGEGRIQEALEAVKDCDVVIAAVGGTSSRFNGGAFDANGALKRQKYATMDCGENVDDCRLQLPGDQLALLDGLKSLGKPVVTVLIGGRPYEMERIHSASDAIVCCFYPGPTGGEAVARLLFGGCEPAGRLCVSLPDLVGQLPVSYNARDSYRAGVYYNAGQPRYGFGSGLSYTDFAYTLEQAPTAGNCQLSFRVQNTGRRPGWAVPQLYLHRLQGVVTARRSQLCGFQKIRLEPGQTKRLTISIPRESLTQWDQAMVQRVVKGQIQWMLRDSGETLLQGVFAVDAEGQQKTL